MSQFIPTGTEKKMCECERLLSKQTVCEGCGKACDKDKCSHGLCESCVDFYLDECASEFGLD